MTIFWYNFVTSPRWQRREWDSALLLIIWGVWLSLPYPTFGAIGLPQHLPEVIWGILAIALGAIHIKGLIGEEKSKISSHRLLWWASALTIGHWLHVALLIVVENPQSPSLPVYAWLVYRSFSSFLRLQVIGHVTGS